MFQHLMRRWLERTFPFVARTVQPRPKPPRRASRSRFMPQLEMLEMRLTPSTFLVTNPNDTAGSAADVTLRYAVNNAQNGDAITFANSLSGGTITLSSVLNISQSVAITGLGAANLAISGNHATQVFNVASGVTASISNLTIKDGQYGQATTNISTSNGGGIANFGTLTLSNTILSGNSVVRFHLGGGIFNAGTLMLSNSILSNNSATSYLGNINGAGGGIYNTGTVTVSSSTLSNNAAYNGGGIFNYRGTVTVLSSTFSGNGYSSGAGGAIYNSGGTVTVNTSTFSANTAANGGAIDNTWTYYFDSGSHRIDVNGTMTVSTSTFNGNIAGNSGGAIFNDGASVLTVSNATVYGNSAIQHGGGIANFSSITMTLQNSIVAGNTMPNNSNPNIFGSYTGANNLIGTDLSGTLGALANHGSPMQTMSDHGTNAVTAGGTVTTVNVVGGINSTTPIITVANAAAIASTPGAYLIRIDGEAMLVTNVNLTTNTLTVVRGYNGTTAAAHSSGAGVYFLTDQRGYAFSGTPDIGAYQDNGVAPLTPTVTSVSPNSGPVSGGTVVTITGANLVNATTVAFGGVAGTILSNSGTQIVAITPAEPAGTVDTTVTTVGWDVTTASPADQYTFGTAGSPIVTSPTVTAITASSATLGGNVVGIGGAPIIKRGILYAPTAINNAPLLGGAGVTEVDDTSATTGVFTENVTGLAHVTSYSFVAFATNSFGVTYTTPVSTFVTPNPGGYYAVTTTADNNNAVDFGHTGTQADPFLASSLRSAVTAASLATDPVVIIFANSLSGATVTVNSLIIINHNLTIIGLGAANLAISGNNTTGVFEIARGVTASISDLTIKNGRAPGNTPALMDFGGAIYNYFGTLTLSNSVLTGNFGQAGGGAINNYYGTLTVINSTFSNNISNGPGGAIDNIRGTVTVSGSTFSGNSTGVGGAIANSGTMTLSNSTVAGNTASLGGGIGNFNGSTLKVINTTISGNSATSNGGGIFAQPTSNLTLKNTILSGNTAPSNPNISGSITSGSNNLTSITGTLGALASNGGPTQTMSDVGTNAVAAGGAVTTVNVVGGISSTVATFKVADAGAIASTPGAYLIRIDSEAMLVTSVNLSASTITVVRGYNGTTQATHTNGAAVYFLTDQRGYSFSGTPDIGAFQSTAAAPGTPTITSVNPTGGTTAGGTSVTITGTNLANAVSVSFGGLPGTIVSDSGTQIVVTTPAATAGAVHTIVTISNGAVSAVSPADVYTFGTSGTASPPTVISPTATAITSTTVTLGGNAASDGGAPITRRGVLYSATNSNPTLAGVAGGSVTEMDDSLGGTGAFTENISGLTPGVTYYYVAFATNSVGTTYTSPVSTFTALSVPTVTNPTATAITSTTATLGGNAVNAGGSAITTRGVLYSSTNSNPTRGGSGVTEVDDSAGGTGVFTVNVSGLTAATTYYYVAFATNSSGTAYTSPVFSFTTLPPGGYYKVETNADNNNVVDFGHAGTQADPFLAPTLRSAVNAADLASGPVFIFFANSLSGSTVTLNSVLTISQDVTITGLGAANLAISGNNHSGVFEVTAGVTASITGLTIEDGKASDGGGIDNNGTLTLSNVTISGNSASQNGGGINSSGALTLSNSTISGNSAAKDGGGINSNGALTLSNSTLSSNSASQNGGGINGNGTLTLSNATLAGNSANGFGGGIYIKMTASMTLINSTLSGNTAVSGGGGIDNNGNLTLSNVTITGNSVSGFSYYGYYYGGYGGGINNNGTLTLRNVTISGNSANANGGGIFSGGTLTLQNSLVAGNTAGTGPDLYGAVTSLGNNLIGQTDDSSSWVASDLTGDSGSPLDPMLDPLGLANNGGPTETIALLSGSPAINAGASSPGIPATDQRGYYRSGNVDIGAFEFDGVPYHLSWGAIGPITYGTDLTGLLNASSDVAGSFAYTIGGQTVTASTILPASGTPYIIVATFTPTDASFPSGTVQQTLTVNEAPTVAIVGATSAIEDGTSTITYRFMRTGDTSLALPINFNVGGSASLINDYTASSTAAGFTFNASAGTVTIAAGSAFADVTITTVSDRLVEGDESVLLTIAIGTPSSASGTITDNDTATVGFATPTGSASEAGGSQNVGVVLTINGVGTGTLGLASAVTVNLTTKGGTATGGGTDYTLPAGPAVTFAAGTYASGTATQNAAVGLTSDQLVEGNETANLGLAIGQNIGSQVTVAGAASTHSLTIQDDDTATVSFTATGTNTAESGSPNVGVVLTINGIGTGTPGLASAVTVNLTTTGGTATGGGTDYTLPAAPAVTFAAGNYATGTATQNSAVAITPDQLVEGDETADLGLSIGQNIGTQVSLGGTTAHALTITDDDTATVSFQSAVGSAVEGAGSKNVGVVLTINGSGTGTAGLASAVTVDLTTTGGTATGGATDYTLPTTPAVTFAAGAYATGTATQNAAVALTSDQLVEGDETANLGLAIVQNIATQVSLGGTTAHTLTIADDDTATVSFQAGSSTSVESGSQNVGVVLTINGIGTGTPGLASAVTVDLTTTGGTATGGGTDYTLPMTPAVTFNAGNYATGTATLNGSVAITADQQVEGDETANLGLVIGQNIGTQVSLGGTTAHTLTINDNDTATVSFQAGSSTSATESGSQNVGVVLTINGVGTGTPGLASAVMVNLTTTGGTATGGGTDYSLPAVTFAAGNYATGSATQNAAVAITPDQLVEGNETADLGLSIGQNIGTQVSLGGTTAHVLTITDNDTATVSFQSAVGSAVEGAGSKNVGVVLTINGSGTGTPGLASAVTVNLTATGGTATGGGTDYMLPATPAVTFAAGGYAAGTATQNAAVALTSDQLVEGDETANLGLAIVQNIATQVSLGGTTAHTLTITDDDTATVSFQAGSSTSVESGSQNVGVVLTINGIGTGTPGLASAVTVNLTTTGGTATGGGTDYTLPAAPAVTFAAGNYATGSATQNAAVAITPDQLVEGDESAVLGLSIGQNIGTQVSLGGTTAYTLTIDDNDTATIAFAAASSLAPEGTTPHLVGVTLLSTANGVQGSGTLAHDVSVNVQDLMTGSAGMGDYTFSGPQTILFATGEAGSTKTASLVIAGDNSSEGNDTVALQLNTLIDGTGGQVSLVAPTAHTVTIVDNDIDLQVTKEESDDSVTAGSGIDNLTYTVTVTNTGQIDANGVTLSELLTLPAGVSVVSVTPSTGDVVTKTTTDYTWNLGSLAVGEDATLTVVLTVGSSTAAGTDIISDTATITGATENLVNTDDDTATESTSVIREIDLMLTKDDGGVQGQPGSTIDYTLTYRNAGPSDATGVVITETLPANTTAHADNVLNGWVDAGGGHYTYAVGNVAAGAAGQTVAFKVIVNNSVPPGTTLVTNTAVIASDGTAAEPVQGNNTATDTTAVNRAPVGRRDHYVIFANHTLVMGRKHGVLANDRDADGQALRAVLLRRPAVGRFVLRPNGTFVYQPRRNFVGQVKFVYRAFDGSEFSKPIRVTITVSSPSSWPNAFQHQ